MTKRATKLSDEDVRRYMALRQIFGPDRVGSVDGVEFDLRHPSLNPGEWFTSILGIDNLSYRSRYQPFIWFPWMGEFDAEALRAEIVADDARVGSPPNEKRLNARIRSSTPEIFAYAGDKLSIAHVESQFFGDAYAHRHDNEIRLAYLHVLRKNGKVTKLKTPLTFTGASALFAPRSSRQYFDVILHRIFVHFGLTRLSDVMAIPEEKFEQGGYDFAALERAYFLAEKTADVRKAFYDLNPFEKEWRDAHNTVSLLNDAVFLGYLWAKAEVEFGMQPLADAAVRAKLGGVAGGRKSGAARREKRAATWEPHARELAAIIRAREPALSQDRLAEEISVCWKLEEIAPPGHKTLKGLISKMEIQGQLPRRVPNRK